MGVNCLTAERFINFSEKPSMKTFFKYFLSLSLTCLITAAVVVGPARLFGVMFAEQTDGQLAKIKPYSSNDGTDIDAYLIEINTPDGAVYVVRSDDPQWLAVNAGERVRARLYPAAPWSTGSGAWQNALLVSKLSNNSLPLPTSPPLLASIENSAVAASPAAAETSIAGMDSDLIGRGRQSDVAFLRSNGGLYYTPSRLLNEGDHPMGPGHFSIQEGSTEISMNSGAHIIVEGPAEFEILTDRHIHLRHGRLTVDVPDEITDFVLTTTNVKITTGSQTGEPLVESDTAKEEDARDSEKSVVDLAQGAAVIDSADDSAGEEKADSDVEASEGDAESNPQAEADDDANSAPDEAASDVGDSDEESSPKNDSDSQEETDVPN
jgi:hypothetical protein